MFGPRVRWVGFEFEGVWFFCPQGAAVFVGYESFEGFESTGEVVGVDEVDEVSAEVLVSLVVEARYGGFFQSPVHAFDLSVGPGMPGFGQTMVDSDQEVKLSLFNAHFRDIDMEVDDRVGLELLAPRPVAFHIGHPEDIVPLHASLQTSMQGGSGQLRDWSLKSAQAIVKQQ
jgi:hypothetical protein